MVREKCYTILQTVVAPLTIAVVGYFIQDAIKQKDINSRLVELSINILSEKPSKEKVPIRTWAVDVVNKYSEVKLDENSKSLLIYNANFVSRKWDDVPNWDEAPNWDNRMGKPSFIESPPKK